MKLLLAVLVVVQLVWAGPLPKEYVSNTPENCVTRKVAEQTNAFRVDLIDAQSQNLVVRHKVFYALQVELIKSGNYKQNIEALGGQFEGDMVLEEKQKRAVLGLEKTGIINTGYRWPNATVPYVLADGFFNQAQVEQIERGLRAIEAASCIRFVHRTDEANYVEVIGEPSGCWSQVGNVRRGRQQLNLQLFEPGVGCFRSGTVVHEFLHTLGFYHMQSATERDDYVLIAWEHILEGLEHNFDKYDSDAITNFGVEYDVVSVMHYNAYAFTKNGFATIIPYDISLIDGMGQHIGMTDLDIQRLNAMYECQAREEQ